MHKQESFCFKYEQLACRIVLRESLLIANIRANGRIRWPIYNFPDLSPRLERETRTASIGARFIPPLDNPGMKAS